jgi:hypothetical protein
MFGGWLGEAARRDGKDRCQLEDAAFEKVYTVFSTNQQEARYILTPKLMEQILAAATATPHLRLSFQQNSVFITIPSSRNRFEMGGLFWGRVTPERACGDLFEIVSMAEQLIGALDLETRLWTRT